MSQQLRSAETLRAKARREEERLERVIARCGPAVHLVIDTMHLVKSIKHHNPASVQAYITEMERSQSIDSLEHMPLMAALQEGRAASVAVQCRHCPLSRPLTMPYQNYSGSSVECLADLVQLTGGTSDHDIMFEIDGPFRWAAEPVRVSEPARISPNAAPQLWAKPTSSPGFVMLYWTRSSRCSHEAPLVALPADSIRRLMLDFCRAKTDSDDTVITCSGPAVNALEPDNKFGGHDHVFCLRLLWWPEEESFLSRRRVTDFPPAATRRDICRFGVHLVPTGRPGSDTEQLEYRVSFSRAEVVTVRHLSPVQHATVTTVKGMKNSLKSTGVEPGLKSYYIKTTVLWLVQDQPSDRWTGVTDCVHMVLDWLEQHLKAGNLPCFFCPAINLLAVLETAKLEDIISTVRQMRSQAIRLMMDCSDRTRCGLDMMLEGGSEPLSERELRVRLSQELVRQAIWEGLIYRSTAPCWEHWFRREIPELCRLSQHQLLQRSYHSDSGAYQQQCFLLQALAVAPADMVPDMRLKSLGDGMYAWSATPLTNILTERDMERFLSDHSDAVADWCHQQLCRPLVERPAGLTAELNTPRGRAELLLQPELYLQAFSEAVPEECNFLVQILDPVTEERWRCHYQPRSTYQECRQWLEHNLRCDQPHHNLSSGSWLHHRLPELDGPTVAATARSWRRHMRLLLSGERLREAYTAVTTRWPDRWQLRKYLVMDSTSKGETRRRSNTFTHTHKRRMRDTTWCTETNGTETIHDRSNQIFGFFTRPFAILMKLGYERARSAKRVSTDIHTLKI